MRNGGGGEEEGATLRSTVPGATQAKSPHGHKIPSVPAPSASSLAPMPSQDPKGGFGGYTAAEPLTWPHALAPPHLFSLGPGNRKVLGWADSCGNSIEFSFAYILKAKVSWTYSSKWIGVRKEEAMAGVGEEAGPLQPPPPQGTHVEVGWQSPPSHLSHPPQHQTRRSPLSPGAAPHPNLGCTFSGFQQSYGSGGHGVGEVALQSQLDSGSDPGLLVHPGTHSLCHLFF